MSRPSPLGLQLPPRWPDGTRLPLDLSGPRPPLTSPLRILRKATGFAVDLRMRLSWCTGLPDVVMRVYLTRLDDPSGSWWLPLSKPLLAVASRLPVSSRPWPGSEAGALLSHLQAQPTEPYCDSQSDSVKTETQALC